ncbi:hypothetical protein BEWA_019540 [Theileria equi strain WA]|uniref:Uncharacterized protein n=1 Tax=Theileria equi strain WA TaxID=1537102 RepID=L0AW35_THEEQ|nr:hypothetical protein BEWA_019540 [Theileria equi strain WA]AFZ79109.1 hypothetical protein BEWA_019540 [Theileria equi strain WA]|eukprot:XP_004828775.1 hypothetical protein BEWA_019540 [Theileria equi strain WA]
MNDSCNTDEFSNAVKKLLSVTPIIYFDYLVNPIAFLLLFNEVDGLFSRILKSLEDNIANILKFSSMCIIDSSPSGKVKQTLLVLRLQELLFTLSNLMDRFHYAHDLSHLDNAIGLIHRTLDKRFYSWSLLHYKAIRRGIVVFLKIVLLAIINHALIPVMIRMITGKLSNAFSKSIVSVLTDNINIKIGI